MANQNARGQEGRSVIWVRVGFLVVSLGAFVFAGNAPSPELTLKEASGRTLSEIRQSGTLVVLTRNAPTTWYIGRDGAPTGPEHDLVEAFASSIGVGTEYRFRPTVSAVLDGIREGEADMAAAGLTITGERRQRFRFGPSYQEVTQQVVCRRDAVQPDSIGDLVGLDIQVIADSSYAERLTRLREREHPGLAWTESEEHTTEQLLRKVWQREIDCTIADSNIVDINRRYFPELMAPINLGREQELGWVMQQHQDELSAAVDTWLSGMRETGRLEHLQEQYYGMFEVFDYVDIRRYIRRIDQRFPRYRDYFRRAAEKHNVPYPLLAAQGYQESHWNAKARSPTGVRGIMMLTLPTAKAMGVTNRLDPKQSIFGGAKYLARMRKRFADEVTEPDRTWLALAAYNVGRGHVHDAQTLARQQGLSPYLWRDIKQVLPLLSDKRYYRKLKYGYARGMEPVRYVQRIREYRHVLEKQLAPSSVRASR